jgi:hypothetical protein
MLKISTYLALAALLTACDGDATKKPAVAEVKAATPADKPVEAVEAAPAKPAPERILADSGLGVGGKFQAFEIVNCDSGEKYCQVCKFGGSPKIMAVGTIDDPAFGEDIKNLDALVKKYGEDKLKAFAVITDIKDGKSATPTADREALEARVKALKAELGVSIPLVVPAEEGGKNEAFDGWYNITQSRTLMFADGRNAVKYSGVAPADLAGLNTAIQEVLGVPADAAAAPKAG